MKFKIDENLPVDLASLLRDEGHDAATVSDQQLAGAADPDVVARCRAEARILITFDLDFSDIRAYPPDRHHGLVVMRLRQQDRDHVLRTFRRLLPLLDEEELTERLWIVDEDRVRIRG